MRELWETVWTNKGAFMALTNQGPSRKEHKDVEASLVKSAVMRGEGRGKADAS